MSNAGSASCHSRLMDEVSVQVVTVAGVDGSELSLKSADSLDSGELSRVTFLPLVKTVASGDLVLSGAVLARCRCRGR